MTTLCSARACLSVCREISCEADGACCSGVAKGETNEKPASQPTGDLGCGQTHCKNIALDILSLSTCICCWLAGDVGHVGHVGDSCLKAPQATCGRHLFVGPKRQADHAGRCCCLRQVETSWPPNINQARAPIRKWARPPPASIHANFPLSRPRHCRLLCRRHRRRLALQASFCARRRRQDDPAVQSSCATGSDGGRPLGQGDLPSGVATIAGGAQQQAAG